MPKIRKILIANRGEIAVRIARACRELRITSVAIFSEADTGARHIRACDEAYPLGDPKPSESYLNIQKIMAVAHKVKVDAIHPGYGFLSENCQFAQACEKAGMLFIGPPSEVIRKMGDKIGAKKLLEKEGIPLIPGITQPLEDLEEAKKKAKEIGYPIFLKAAAGGGGKGMQVVTREADLGSALEGCQRVAQSAFGDQRIFMEKYLENPRHVEFQIMADVQGHVIHLFERECSIQRRHQKIIEETPSPVVDDELRKRMGETAVKIGKIIGYRNVGTVEFILDAERNFYFLEVNTRLQVEHPITEMVTGVDLVKGQIGIAEGESIVGVAPHGRSVQGNHGGLPLQQGHALQCRIYAEDPQNHFFPSIGRITKLREPVGEGIRVDSGIDEGWTVPIEYDPMLAKLIVHAPTRERAIMKMLGALQSYEIEGICTNIPFLIDLLRHPAFIAGRINTSFIEKYFKDWQPVLFSQRDPFNPWNQTMDPAMVGAALRGRPVPGRMHKQDSLIDHDLTAPMPGQVVKVLVKEGQKVVSGETLMVLEAMKMEHSILAPKAGTIKKIFYQHGERVGMGEKLVELV